MTSTKLLAAGTTVLLAIATLAAGAAPARAATPGFHAAYFSESSFLTSAPGQSGQFAVGFQNSGDQAWVKADPSRTAALHTAAPLDNSSDFSAGWSVNWTAPNIYAEQLNDIAPGGVAYFIYNYIVPTGAGSGPHTFYGRPFVGSSPLEDYGYYQIVTVSSTTSLTITGTSPTSPSTTVNPTVTGTGAPAGVTVTIKDGTTTVGTGLADSAGNFSIIVSFAGANAAGTHSLVASAPGAGQSAAFTYVVSANPAPTANPGNTVSPQVSTVTQPGFGTMIVTFTKTMAQSTITATNFRWDSANFPGTVTLSSGGTTVRLDFNSTSEPTVATHALDIQNVTDTDGNRLNPTVASSRITVTSDSTRPSLSAVTAVSPQTLEVTYNESMAITGEGFASGVAIDAAANYQLLNQDGTASSISVTAATTGGTDSDAAIFNLTKVRLALNSPTLSGSSYSLRVSNVTDQATNAISPNPALLSFAGVGTTTNAPTVSSTTLTSTASNPLQTLAITYSKAMKHAVSQTSATFTSCTGSGAQIDTKTNYSSTPTDLGAAIQNSGTLCTISSDERTVTFQIPTSAAVAPVSGGYTLSVSNVQDSVGNPIAASTTVNVSGGAVTPIVATFISAASMSVKFNTAMVATSCTSTCNSAGFIGNYQIVTPSGHGFGDVCNGSTTVASTDNLTFTITCGTSGVWGTSGSNVIRVQNAASSGTTTVVNPNPSGNLPF